MADEKPPDSCYTMPVNSNNLAHLLPSFAQGLAVPTGPWAKSFKDPLGIEYIFFVDSAFASCYYTFNSC